MAGLTLSLLGPRSGARSAGFTTRWRRLDLHLLEWSQGGSWWFTAPLPPDATTVTFSIGAGLGMNGSCLRPLT